MQKGMKCLVITAQADITCSSKPPLVYSNVVYKVYHDVQRPHAYNNSCNGKSSSWTPGTVVLKSMLPRPATATSPAQAPPRPSKSETPYQGSVTSPPGDSDAGKGFRATDKDTVHLADNWSVFRSLYLYAYLSLEMPTLGAEIWKFLLSESHRDTSELQPKLILLQQNSKWTPPRISLHSQRC